VPLVGGGHRDRGRRVGRIIDGEVAGQRVLVEELILGVDVALGVLWRTEAGGFGLADPRLHLRPGEHRPALRMIGDRDLGADLVGKLRRQQIGADGKIVDPADDAAGHRTGRAQGKGGGDVAAVDRHFEVRHIGVRRRHDLDQRIATGNEIGAVRQDHDLQLVGLGCITRRRGT
jgi:hypothetical protein